MSKPYNEGDTVQWNWGNGTAKGKIKKTYTKKVTRKIKGNEGARPTPMTIILHIISNNHMATMY